MVEQGVDFCTLGMFIIDEIEFLPPLPRALNVPGGAGTFAALGARLFSPPPLSNRIGWIVDAGSDFPPELRQRLRKWETRCLIRDSPKRLTTRAWNEYQVGGQRLFKYLTPKLVLNQFDLTPELVLSKSFHLICSPKRCIELVEGIKALRADPKLDQSLFSRLPPPLFVWEPVPDCCRASELQSICDALQYVDVVSPNHDELAGLFTGLELPPSEGPLDPKLVERWSFELLKSGVGEHGLGAVVVRAGALGCYIATGDLKRRKWLPAYHQSDPTSSRPNKVVDPTGAGNTFLGGLAIGLVRGGRIPGLLNIEEAAVWATVAASFAVEQVGLPMLIRDADGESWNGVSVMERLQEYKWRLSRRKSES